MDNDSNNDFGSIDVSASIILDSAANWDQVENSKSTHLTIRPLSTSEDLQAKSKPHVVYIEKTSDQIANDTRTRRIGLGSPESDADRKGFEARLIDQVIQAKTAEKNNNGSILDKVVDAKPPEWRKNRY